MRPEAVLTTGIEVPWTLIPEAATPPARRVLTKAIIAAAVPWLLVLATCAAGLDFGTYWDDEAMFTKVRSALLSPPTLLPQAYDYGSVTFWLALAGVAPEAAVDPGLRHRVPDTSRLIDFTRTNAYRIRVRGIYLAVSSLAILWISALTLSMGGTTAEAVLAAMIAAGSWEMNYHLRWVAPDGITTQFAAAAVFACVMAMRGSPALSKRWCAMSSIAVGLAAGTKYSAWPLVVPLAMASWSVTSGRDTLRGRLALVFWMLSASVAVYLISTPGSLLQPTLFVSGIRWQIAHYALGHDSYTISRPMHVLRLLEYVSTVLLSPYAAVAIGTAVIAMAGVYSSYRESGRRTLLVLSFPVCYATYLSAQHVMIVRNYLVLLPFAAAFAAKGVHYLWTASAGISARPLRALLIVAVSCSAGLNVAYEVRAAETIRHRSAGRTLAEFETWLATQPRGDVIVSPRIAASLTNTAIIAGAAPGSRAGASLAFSTAEVARTRLRPNVPRSLQRTFGPREVNLSYYPDWAGDEHIVVLSAAEAKRDGISLP